MDKRLITLISVLLLSGCVEKPTSEEPISPSADVQGVWSVFTDPATGCEYLVRSEHDHTDMATVSVVPRGEHGLNQKGCHNG